jgi:hypothetical protein
MKKTRKRSKPLPAESIARLADRGKDLSRFFTNAGPDDGTTDCRPACL